MPLDPVTLAVLALVALAAYKYRATLAPSYFGAPAAKAAAPSYVPPASASMNFDQAMALMIQEAKREAERLHEANVLQEAKAAVLARMTPVSSALPVESTPHPAALLADKPSVPK